VAATKALSAAATAIATVIVATMVCSGNGSASCSQEPARSLPGRKDTYGGIVLDPTGLPADPDEFAHILGESLAGWRAAGIRGVWLEVPLEKSRLLGVAAERGFVFHHAEPSHCMMTIWLPDTPSPLPPNPSHQVGVGALCVNEDGKVLLVQEAVGPASLGNIWKIPTGLLNAREDIEDGVERELLEETGVRGKFEKVLSFRHCHAAPWGKSDLFFICLLRASRDAEFHLQEGEIRDARWADFQEFLSQAPYPRDIPVWSKAYGSCVGPDGVVGNVPGIRMDKCLARSATFECVYF